MNAQEFSSEFDLLYNNVSSNQAPGLTEYEKSVFLTKAQDEIIKNNFTNVQGGNKYQQGVEDSEKRYADFSALLTVVELNNKTDHTVTFDERGKIFTLPDGDEEGNMKVMIVITETFKTGNSNSNLTSYQVIPLKFDEYIRLMSKPSSDPLKKQVWKLMGNNESGNGSIEIVPHWKDKDNTINKLILKYIRKPYPIILEDLSSQGLSIEGYKGTGGSRTGPATTKGCCELASELHPEILQRAVELAKIFYTGDNQQVITAGTRSE